MVLIVKKKTKCYKKYEKDIWGICYTDARAGVWWKEYNNVWILRFFFFLLSRKKRTNWNNRKRYVYRIDLKNIPTRKRKYNWKWLSLRFLRLYFLTITDRQFRRLFKKASKLEGNLESNYCHLLEGRLLHLFYRTNFLTDPFWIMDFIKYGNVLLNNKAVSQFNTLVTVGTFITFNKHWKNFLYKWLKKRALIRALLFNTPRFLQVSFRFAYAIFLKKQRKEDLVYPIPLDLQRITGYS